MRRTLALGFALVATVATNAFAVGEARLTGKVLDATTKAPIPNAKITVVATEAKTFKKDYPVSKDGSYTVFLLDGTIKYKFSFSAPGYQTFEDVVKLKLGEPNFRDIFLTSGQATTQAGTSAASVPQSDSGSPALKAFNEGAALANEGKDAEAITKLEAAVAAKPDLTAGWQALTRLYIRTGAYAKAAAAGEKVLAIDSDDADVNAMMYEAYSKSGNAAKAAEFRKKAPQNASALFNDAAKLINAGKDAEAETVLRQAVSADPKMAIAYYELGMVQVRTGKNADARANLQKYLELDPKGKDAATAKEMLSYVK